MAQVLIFSVSLFWQVPTDTMGMVFIMLSATLIISFLIGLLQNHALESPLPVITAIIFIPSVFIYYNGSALVPQSLVFLLYPVSDCFFGALIKTNTE